MLERVRTSANPAWFPTDKCFIGGRWVEPESGETLPVEDPSRGVEIGEIARGEAPDIDAAVEAAERALAGEWGKLTATERGRLMMKLAGLISERVDELAHIEALDVGKPLKQGRADALAMARYMEFYGGAADKVMGETIPYLDGYTVYTLREPHGVTGHIVPWNYPMQIAGRTIGAALAMGNACVLKPAEEACLTSLALADLAREAGFPAGALNVVPGLGEVAGAALAAHPGVRHLSFTGSVAVGRARAGGRRAPRRAGDARTRRQIAPARVRRRRPRPRAPFPGQCGHTERRARPARPPRAFWSNASAMAKSSSAWLSAIGALRVGPADADLDVGPLISERQKAIVTTFIAEGADLRIGRDGRRSSRTRRPADILSRRPCSPTCRPDHRLAQEEIFGPVQVVIPFDDEAEAIGDRQRRRLRARGGRYGRPTAAGRCGCAKALRAGQVFLNNYGAGGGVELPFGGVGKSGHGREKGFEALYGFSALKTVAAWHG